MRERKHKDILQGMSGSDVIVFQKSLLAKGYYDGKIDGVYGDGTAKAVLLLQYDSFPYMKQKVSNDAGWLKFVLSVVPSKHNLSPATSTDRAP